MLKLFTVQEELEAYQAIAAEFDVDPTRAGREIARRLGIDRNRVSRILRLSRHPEYLQAVMNGDISLNRATALIAAGGVEPAIDLFWLKDAEFVAEFWSRVVKTDTCWYWLTDHPAARMEYATLSINGKGYKAHRLAFAIANGYMPDGLLVRHKCDVPRCVRPDHLEVGTAKDNAQDRVLRGRQRNGYTAKAS